MTIKINDAALRHARQLIKDSKIARDTRDDWSEHAPDTEKENAFIDKHGYPEYGTWHRGEDTAKTPDTKGRYSFPFGDFKRLHRCASRQPREDIHLRHPALDPRTVPPRRTGAGRRPSWAASLRSPPEVAASHWPARYIYWVPDRRSPVTAAGSAALVAGLFVTLLPGRVLRFSLAVRLSW
jgi:hypothetical protein